MPKARTIRLNGAPIALGGRAFDLLLVLLRARGDVVRKAEIFREVWPLLHVEESSLRFQIAVLRKRLGVDRDVIKTVPGRGYLFAAEVEEGQTSFGLSAASSHSTGCGIPGSESADLLAWRSSGRPLNPHATALEQENAALKRVLADLISGLLRDKAEA